MTTGDRLRALIESKLADRPAKSPTRADLREILFAIVDELPTDWA